MSNTERNMVKSTHVIVCSFLSVYISKYCWFNPNFSPWWKNKMGGDRNLLFNIVDILGQSYILGIYPHYIFAVLQYYGNGIITIAISNWNVGLFLQEVTLLSASMLYDYILGIYNYNISITETGFSPWRYQSAQLKEYYEIVGESAFFPTHTDFFL